MNVEYRRDLYHNYMVVTDPDTSLAERYCIKLLGEQAVDGMLSMETRSVDNSVSYYYEITARQSLNHLVEKTLLTYHKVKQVLMHIIDIIERANEYLMVEDDFVLLADHIYIDISTNLPYLCYLPGYHKDIKIQINELIEFFMNKIDYKDKDGVLLVYRLYSVSKEETYTFSQILTVLKDGVSFEAEAESETHPMVEEGEEAESELKKIELLNVPMMMEKMEKEEEIAYYPLKIYIETGVSIIIGILIIVASLVLKVTYNTYGGRIDFGKLAGLILIILCLEGYVMSKLWDKKNQRTKIVTFNEYQDPRILDEGVHDQMPFIYQGSQQEKDDFSRSLHSQEWIDQEEPIEEIDNPTCILNQEDPTQYVNAQKDDTSKYVLTPVDQERFDQINITEFPFYIGKLKENVDYCLKKDAVSRYHAKITREKDQFYLVDLNSTNGTFLNEERLITYQPKEMHLGDEISFANIKYKYKYELKT